MRHVPGEPEIEEQVMENETVKADQGSKNVLMSGTGSTRGANAQTLGSVWVEGAEHPRPEDAYKDAGAPRMQ